MLRAGPPPPGSSASTLSRPTSRMRSRWGRTVLGWRSRLSATSAVVSGHRRAGQLEVDGVAGVVAEGLEHRQPTIAAPVEFTRAPSVESRGARHRHPAHRGRGAGPPPRGDRPRAGRRRRRPRHGPRRQVDADGTVDRDPGPHHRRLPAAGPAPDRRRRRGSAPPLASPRHASTGPRWTPSRRPHAMGRARWHAARDGAAHGGARSTPGCWPSPPARAAWASRR